MALPWKSHKVTSATVTDPAIPKRKEQGFYHSVGHIPNHTIRAHGMGEVVVGILKNIICYIYIKMKAIFFDIIANSKWDAVFKVLSMVLICNKCSIKVMFSLSLSLPPTPMYRYYTYI